MVLLCVCLSHKFDFTRGTQKLSYSIIPGGKRKRDGDFFSLFLALRVIAACLPPLLRGAEAT